MCIFQILIHSLPTISCHFTVTVNVCLGKVGLLSISIAWTKSESIQKGHRGYQHKAVLFSLQQCLRTYNTETRKTCFAMPALNYYWILSPSLSRSKSHQSKSKKITTVEPETRVSCNTERKRKWSSLASTLNPANRIAQKSKQTSGKNIWRQVGCGKVTRHVL